MNAEKAREIAKERERRVNTKFVHEATALTNRKQEIDAERAKHWLPILISNINLLIEENCINTSLNQVSYYPNCAIHEIAEHFSKQGFSVKLEEDDRKIVIWW